jgi:hypothetical protein
VKVMFLKSSSAPKVTPTLETESKVTKPRENLLKGGIPGLVYSTRILTAFPSSLRRASAGVRFG